MTKHLLELFHIFADLPARVYAELWYEPSFALLSKSPFYCFLLLHMGTWGQNNLVQKLFWSADFKTLADLYVTDGCCSWGQPLHLHSTNTGSVSLKKEETRFLHRELEHQKHICFFWGISPTLKSSHLRFLKEWTNHSQMSCLSSFCYSTRFLSYWFTSALLSLSHVKKKKQSNKHGFWHSFRNSCISKLP